MTTVNKNFVVKNGLEVATTSALTGAATLANTISVTGAATLSNTLSVTGLTTLSGEVNVTGTANVSTDVNVGANVNIDTTQISVGNSTVNTVITSSSVTGQNVVSRANFMAGTINATGTGFFANSSSISVGNTSVNVSMSAGLLSTSGNAAISGNLTVTGLTTLNGGIKLGDAAADQLNITASVNSNIVPVSGNNLTLGNTTQRWSELYVNNVIATTNVTAAGVTAGDVTISGNLTVSGTTTYINTTDLNVGDNKIVLNADLTGVTAPSEDAGFIVNRGSAANVEFVWDETNDRWYAASNTFLGSNLTVVGSATVNTDFTVNGNTKIGNAVTDVLEVISVVNTNVIPVGGNTVTLGNTTNRWGQLYVGNAYVTTEVNSPSYVAGTINATSAGFKANTTYIGIGNSSVNTVITSSSIDTDGTLAVLGAATLSNTIAVTGAATLSNTVGVTGAATFSNTIAVTGAATLSNTIAVTGTTTLSNTLAVTGSVVLSNTANVIGTFGVAGLTSLFGGATVTGVANASVGMNVGANVNLSTTQIKVGNSTVNTVITSTTINTDGTLAVLGAATLSNTIAVTGAATLSNTLTVTGLSSLNGELNVTGTANVSVDLNVGANVNLLTDRINVGNSTVNTFLTSSAIETDGTLTVAGATSLNGTIKLGDATGDTVSINGYVNTAITPSANITYDLGTAALVWRNVYANTVTATGLSVDQLLMSNGTLSTPSISFISDPNTGFYSPAADNIAITAGGSQKFVANSTYAGHFFGDVLTTADFISLSDVRKKTNITPIVGSTELINNIRGVTYTLIETGETSSGVIAQEIEKIFPHLVHDDAGFKSVKYNGLIAYLIEAVKDMSKEINVLKAEIENMKGEK